MPATRSFEQLHGPFVRLLRPCDVTRQRQRIGERERRTPFVCRLSGATELERLPGVCDGRGCIAAQQRDARPVLLELEQILADCTGGEQTLGLVDVVLCSLDVLARERDLGRENVRACEMERVVGRLKQRDRLADVLESGALAAFVVSESRDRSVEPHAHIRICGLADPLERAPDDFLRSSDLAHVAQRVTEKRRVPRFD